MEKKGKELKEMEKMIMYMKDKVKEMEKALKDKELKELKEMEKTIRNMKDKELKEKDNTVMYMKEMALKEKDLKDKELEKGSCLST